MSTSNTNTSTIFSSIDSNASVKAPNSPSYKDTKFFFTGSTEDENATVNLITSPTRNSIWYRGHHVVIRWNYLNLKLKKIRLELRQIGSEATTLVCECTENNGLYEYDRVPWGMLADNDYYIRLSSIDNRSFHVESEIFSISTESNISTLEY